MKFRRLFIIIGVIAVSNLGAADKSDSPGEKQDGKARRKRGLAIALPLTVL